MEVVQGPPHPQGLPPQPMPSNLNFQLVPLTGPQGESIVGIMATVSNPGGQTYVFLSSEDSRKWAAAFVNAADEADANKPSGLVIAEVLPPRNVLDFPNGNGGRPS